MNPDVSVIVIAYNIEDYIEECLDSVINQTYENIEIIIVDDGSTDNTAGIVDEYALIDDRIKVIHKKNGGSNSARLAGVSVACGKYATFIDGDDWIDRGFIREMVGHTGDNSVDIVTSGIINEDKTTSRMFGKIPTGIYERNEIVEYIIPNMLSVQDWPLSYGLFPFLWGKLFRRERVQASLETVPPEIVKGEDVIAFYPILFDSERIVVTDTCGYHYRRWSGSITMKLEKETLVDLNYRHNFLKKIFEDHKDFVDSVMPQFYTYYWHNLLQQQSEELFDSEKEIFLPFGIKRNEKIIVFGMGKYSNELKEILDGFCEIVAYTSSYAYKKKTYHCKKVITINEIKKYEYDKIVIAIKSRDASKEVKEMLECFGYSSVKIAIIQEPERLQNQMDVILAR